MYGKGEAEVSGSSSPAYYEIRIEGVLDSHWAGWFDGLHMHSERSETVITGRLADQSALHGVLAKVRDLGLCLTSVRRLGPATSVRERSHEKRSCLAGQPRRPGATPGRRPANRWLVLTIVLLAVFMQLLDTTITTVAIPSIQSPLPLNLLGVQLVTVDLFLLVLPLLAGRDQGGEDRQVRARIGVALLAVVASYEGGIEMFRTCVR
jgi:hypothetical protein